MSPQGTLAYFVPNLNYTNSSSQDPALVVSHLTRARLALVALAWLNLTNRCPAALVVTAAAPNPPSSGDNRTRATSVRSTMALADTKAKALLGRFTLSL
jgi:hypothetical protein